MPKKFMVAVCVFTLILAVGACKKKQEQPVTQPGMPGHMQPGMPSAPGAPGQPNVMMPKGETKVVVPDAVQGKWKGVVIEVVDKKNKKSSDYTVNLNSDFSVPNSNLKITVGDFLPDFKMNGLDITSATNEPNNPAVAVRVYEGGNQVFPAAGKKWAWLYSRPEFRSMHPFDDPNYGISLKNGVKKG